LLFAGFTFANDGDKGKKCKKKCKKECAAKEKKCSSEEKKKCCKKDNATAKL
jgi:hypothetical protein